MSVYVNNITVNTGEYFSRDFYLDNLDGTPLDLTGYSGSSQIRKHANSLNPTATFTLTFVDRVNGRIRIALPSATTTTIKPGRYVYDILFTDDSGSKSIVIEGNILATADVSLGCTFPEYQGGESGGGESGGGESGGGESGGGESGGGYAGNPALAYDYYLITYTATGISTSRSRSLATRTIVTSPDPQTIPGYTGFSTVGAGYTTRFQPAHNYRDEDVPAHVGIPTYLSFGGGRSARSYGIQANDVGSNRIVFGNPSYEDYDGTLVGVAGTGIGIVYIYDLDGNPINQITPPDGLDNNSFGNHVRIHGDNIIIADDYYSGTHEYQGAIYVYDLNGNYQRRILLDDAEEDDYWPYSMAVDNGRIFSTDYNWDTIYIHNVDGTGDAIIINESDLTHPSEGSLGEYGIAAGNDRFAVTDYEQVYVFNQDGTGESVILAPVGTDGYEIGDFPSQVAIAGTSLFVADALYDDNPDETEHGAVYSYPLADISGSSIPTPTIFTPSDYVSGEYIPRFDYVSYGNERHLVATTDYVWYGAHDYDAAYQEETGAVYRWDFDGSNGVRIDPPQDHNQEPFGAQYGQMISADSASNRFIMGVGDYGAGVDFVPVYTHAGIGTPLMQITDRFDDFHDYVLLDVNNVLSAHAGTQEVSLEFRAGFKYLPNPGHPNNEVRVSVTGFKGGTMQRFGGTWINPTASQTTTIGVTTGIGSTQIRYGDLNVNPSNRTEDLGSRIGLGNIDIVNGTITFT